ncbi:MAG: hypothetical protein U0263_10055 [Polyangiaceae bacterium]
MEYPEEPLNVLAEMAGSDPLDQLALFVVACFEFGMPTVNLIAPIVVGTASRRRRRW